MAKVPQFNNLWRGSSVNFNVTTYFQAYSTFTTTENDRKVSYYTTGVVSGLQVIVSANTIATSATIVRTRVNGANGGQSVSIPAGSTGSFQDTTGSDTLASGDDFNFQVVTPNTSGALTIIGAHTVFSATTNTVAKFITRNGSTSNSSVTRYSPISGGSIGEATEAVVQTKIKTAGTFKNLICRIESNARTLNETVVFRKNGATGNQSVTITALTTGEFSDTSNTDTVAIDDLLNIAIIFSSSTGLIFYGFFSSIDFETTNSKNVIVQSQGVPTFAANITRYIGLGADGGDNITAESSVQSLAQVPATLSKLACYVSSNTIVENSTLRLRKNTANGNQAVTITGLTTGFFEDASNTDTVVGADVINYSLATGATGTSLDMILSNMLWSEFVPIRVRRHIFHR